MPPNGARASLWIDEYSRLKRLKRMGLSPPYEYGPREIAILLYIDTQIDVAEREKPAPKGKGNGK